MVSGYSGPGILPFCVREFHKHPVRGKLSRKVVGVGKTTLFGEVLGI
jgi:hypothetical protein